MADEQMPHDLQTEAQVLGMMLSNESAVLPVMERLAQRNAFYQDLNNNIFDAAWRLWNKGESVTPAAVKLEASGDVADVLDKTVSSSKTWGTSKEELAPMCQMLLDLKERRDHWFWATKVVQYAADLRKDIKLLRGLAAFIPKTVGVPLDADPHIDEGIEKMLAKAADNERTGYVPTGIARLDHLLDGGFAPNTLVVLGARRSTGKTAVGSAMALHAMRRRLKVAWIACEMGRVEMLGRWATALSGVSLSHRRAVLSEEEQKRVDEAVAFLSYSQPILIDNAMTIEDLATNATRWKAQGRLDILIIDYIQIMKMRAGRSMYEQLSEFVVGLKQLAQKLEIPILALAQCRREADPSRARREVKMAHLKGTGGLEETADGVILMWQSDVERQIICHLAKNRNGPPGFAKLYADFGRMRVGEWEEEG